MVEENQLSTMKKWFEQLGAKVEEIPPDKSKGRDLPSLGISFGEFRLNAVVDPGGSAVLLLTMKMGDDVRKLAHSVGEDAQRKMIMLLKQALMANPRLAWAFGPSTATLIEQIQEIQLMQRFRVKEDDASTFNRFADALQEVATVQTAVRELFSATLGTPPPARRKPTDIDASSAYR